MVYTKTDFLSYLDSPLHTWARLHSQADEQEPSPFEQHLSLQGYQIEELAKIYLGNLAKEQGKELLWQETFTDMHFQARADALLYDPVHESYDLIEIKSGTQTHDSRHLADLAYQLLIIREHKNIASVAILTVNPSYVRKGDVDPASFFAFTPMNATVQALLPSISLSREQMHIDLTCESPKDLEKCLDPETCPCRSLCHPNVPEHSIYELAGLWRTHKKELQDAGILSMFDIPETFPLMPKQRRQIEVTRTGKPSIHPDMIRHELEKLTAPLSFLDYETFNPGIPQYDGYSPYGTMVFQYSLHVVTSLDTPPRHFEHIVSTRVDPSKEVVSRLFEDLPRTGTVIAWNKEFEMGCNRMMGELYPGYRDFLEDVNTRMYDLGDPFKNNDMLVIPELRGRWSIKKVLPVLVPELSYARLPIGEGATAMNAWWKMVYGETSPDEAEKIRRQLLDYCGLDTFAMVAIWKKLIKFAKKSPQALD